MAILGAKQVITNVFQSIVCGLDSIHNAFQDKNYDVAIYAGIDHGLTTHKDMSFGIYCVCDDTAIWMPASTSDPETMSILNAMETGQSFKILSETSEGPLGTIINGIRVDQDCRFYSNITENSGPIVNLFSSDPVSIKSHL